MIFRRKIYDRMKDWKEKWSGEYALLIEGARRVGKSTIVKEFVSTEYDSSIILDFYKPKDGVIDIFERYSNDYGRLFTELQAIYNVRLVPGKSAVVFDEVQLFPRAREMIKGLVEYGRYAYIETGSLISIRTNVRNIMIPSEEMRVEMHPMDFEEFLWACGETIKIDLIKEHFGSLEPLGEGLHGTMLELYKSYMLVGGMPQAVSKFISTGRYSDVEQVKKQIIALYHDDLGKIPVSGGTFAREIFDNIPALLNRHDKTFSPGAIRKGSRKANYLKSLVWLEDSKICNICYMNSDPEIVIRMSIDSLTLKCYLLDTGLLITMSMGRPSSAEEIYKAFVRNRLSINEGMFFENSVAQALRASGHDLYFAKFYTDAVKKHMMEVDFLLPDGRKIVPLEVKSGYSVKHTSIDRFSEKFGKRVGRRYIIHGKDLRIDGDTVYLPIYMAHLI